MIYFVSGALFGLALGLAAQLWASARRDARARLPAAPVDDGPPCPECAKWEQASALAAATQSIIYGLWRLRMAEEALELQRAGQRELWMN
jgi:hypothetical protein